MIRNHFLQHNAVWLKAAKQEDGAVAEFSNWLSFSHHELAEIWLIPEDEPAISSTFLEKATMNSVAELFSFYNPADVRSGDEAYFLQEKLLDGFFPQLPYSETTWHYSIKETEAGPVISIVFGNYHAMNKMYDKGIRPRPLSETDV